MVRKTNKDTDRQTYMRLHNRRVTRETDVYTFVPLSARVYKYLFPLLAGCSVVVGSRCLWGYHCLDGLLVQ